ncbi:hypothetical protein [Halovulum sp. GXIMD14793]
MIIVISDGGGMLVSMGSGLRIAAVCLALGQGFPAFAQAEVEKLSAAYVINVFDTSCVDTFLRKGGKQDLSEAFASVGLTQANMLYRSDPDRPIMGYLNEDYINGGMICAVEFPKMDDEGQSLMDAYLAALPAEDVSPAQDMESFPTGDASNEPVLSQYPDMPKRRFNGISYSTYVMPTEIQGANFHSVVLAVH